VSLAGGGVLDLRRLTTGAVRSSALARHAIGVGAAAAAILLRLGLDPLWGLKFPFILFFPAVMLSGWLGGLGPGIVTTVLCAAAAEYFWIEPARSFTMRSGTDLVSLLIFAAIGALISVLNDAWRRAAAAVIESEDRFRLAVEAAPAAMIMVDRRGTIVLVNALTEQLLGYARDEIVGQSIERLVPARLRDHHPLFRAAFYADPRPRPMGAGRDLYAVRKDGSEVAVEIGLSPIDSSGAAFVLAAVTDITVRKQIEAERAQLLVDEQAARAELERASRLKDEFLAVLSHELRTPLNAVLGYAQLLGAGTMPPERAAHAVEVIQRNAQALARLVESLLDLSRIIAGKLELDLERLNLCSAVDAAVDVIRPEADAKAIALDVDLAPAEISILADRGRLEQAFWNLLSNAIKFTPRGGRVAVRVTTRDDEARIQVIDNGEGISADFLPYVFDRFKQAGSQKRPAQAGLGLGLALVREMVQAHGGTIAAESPGPGRGSTFTITLPLTAPAKPQAPASA